MNEADNEWNSNFQRILKERLPDIEFRVTSELDRSRLNSTKLREKIDLHTHEQSKIAGGFHFVKPTRQVHR